MKDVPLRRSLRLRFPQDESSPFTEPPARESKPVFFSPSATSPCVSNFAISSLNDGSVPKPHSGEIHLLQDAERAGGRARGPGRGYRAYADPSTTTTTPLRSPQRPGPKYGSLSLHILLCELRSASLTRSRRFLMHEL